MSNKKIKIIAIIIVLILIVSTGFGLVAHYSNWFTNWDKFNPFNWEKNDQDDKQDKYFAGAFVNPSINNGISVVSSAIAAEDFESNNISAEADTGYTLTATLQSNQTRNMQIDWFVSWQKESDWSNGKNVSDYLTLNTTTTQSGEAVILTCHKDFAEKINIVATSNLDKTKKAFCVVDYIKKVKFINYRIGEQEFSNISLHSINFIHANTPCYVYYEPVYSENYTLNVNYECEVVGKFTYTFGYGQDQIYGNVNSENKFAFSNGASIYNLLPVTEEIKSFVLKLIEARSYTEDGYINGVFYIDYIDEVIAEYDLVYQNISSEDKKNRYVEAACFLYYTLKGLRENGKINLHYFKSYVDAHAPLEDFLTETTFDFMNLNLSNVEEFVERLKQCAQNGVGVMEYTLTYTAADIVYTTSIQFGYKESSLNVFNVNVDLPPNIVI